MSTRPTNPDEASEWLAGELARRGFKVQRNGDSLGLGGNVCGIECDDEELLFALLAGLHTPSNPRVPGRER